jgi:hypothetical protein
MGVAEENPLRPPMEWPQQGIDGRGISIMLSLQLPLYCCDQPAR